MAKRKGEQFDDDSILYDDLGNKRGSSSFYRTPEGLMYLEGLARDGYTFEDIANKIGVSKYTFRDWRNKYEDIAIALSKGREIVDYMVENALLKTALGYRTKESKVVMQLDRRTGKMVTIKKETIEKEIQPNVMACTVWLNNRCPDKWKRNRDNVVEIDDEDTSVQISVVRKRKSGDEDEWNDSIELRRNSGDDGDSAKTARNKKRSTRG